MNGIEAQDNFPLQLAMPSMATTKSGIPFNPSADIWSYTDGAHELNARFSRITRLAADVRNSFKHVLLWYVKNKSTEHVQNIFNRTVQFDAWLSANFVDPVQEISQYHIAGYYSYLSEDRKYYLGVLKGLFKKWHRLGYPGISAEGFAALDQLKIKGNRKGEAVAIFDPTKGPFTEIERQAIMDGLGDALTQDSISREEYVLVCLYSLLGQRSIQYAYLKLCDVLVASDEGGARQYFLNIPRAKQRNQPIRTSFKMRPLIPQVGELLLQHVDAVRARFQRPEYRATIKDVSNAPLFPADEQNNDAPGFEYHLLSKELGQKLKSAVDRLNVISERTGEPIHINPYRFRYTIGTNAAQEGHGELVIAEMLDHSDTQNVKVYVKSTPAIIDRIDRAVAMKLAPMAQAFAGKIIRHESEALRGNDPRSRIRDPRIEPSMKPMGSCGHFGFCGFAAPIACYTCKSFQPWLDGPHEVVLTYLLKNRERLLQTSDLRIASVNDRTILAVAEVIQRCDTIKKQNGVSANGQ
jgi:hypothetical protein